jgi:ribulose 1,5-bisphosphate carboxylase large subunit-like protein
MLFGYFPGDEDEIKRIVNNLQNNNVVPTMSCGLHPGTVNKLTKTIGNDYLGNVGSALHSHPNGTGAGVRAMRQAIDGTFNLEYNQAIKQWGKI